MLFSGLVRCLDSTQRLFNLFQLANVPTFVYTIIDHFAECLLSLLGEIIISVEIALDPYKFGGTIAAIHFF
jgi:hypothetical protein